MKKMKKLSAILLTAAMALAAILPQAPPLLRLLQLLQKVLLKHRLTQPL